ncbi:hypothetical protein FSW04_02145 [Baekduia soli]|uniref:DNA-binding protein n=1 Tax=Baekduia soli TaxID=496014 RepID=A0A5B8U0J4_9ACTN|nr:OB-fold nucleic acid binding domain-containing protein [Baekduia soli]QEC46496.1 hypothetical protein FSW04_02145 [Baekduia soli]
MTDAHAIPGTGALDATIAMPYTLTAGPAAGQFLAELAARRIVGSRCAGCARVMVPAQDFCGRCGGAAGEDLVVVAPTGVLTAITHAGQDTLVFVRLDGAGADLLHRLVGATGEEAIGTRVEAVWADEPAGGMLDLAGFRAAEAPEEPAAIAPLTGGAERIVQLDESMELHYRHAYGPYYGRLFDELGARRRIMGVRCPSCQAVLVPPRPRCDVCHVKTATWVDVQDTGTLKAFSVIHLAFVGQRREPPYIYAEIVLDGASTKLIHMLSGVDIDTAPQTLRPGARVRAVWNDDADPTGTLQDILHFELLPGS